MVERESVRAMTRNRLSRLKLAPLIMSQTKCEAVEALPPLPQTKIRWLVSRAWVRIAIASCTALRSRSEAGAFDHVADEVRGGGSAAAIAANEDSLVGIPSLGENRNRFLYGVEVQIGSWRL